MLSRSRQNRWPEHLESQVTPAGLYPGRVHHLILHVEFQCNRISIFESDSITRHKAVLEVVVVQQSKVVVDTLALTIYETRYELWVTIDCRRVHFMLLAKLFHRHLFESQFLFDSYI